jgi:hypothetical protein
VNHRSPSGVAAIAQAIGSPTWVGGITIGFSVDVDVEVFEGEEMLVVGFMMQALVVPNTENTIKQMFITLFMLIFIGGNSVIFHLDKKYILMV